MNSLCGFSSRAVSIRAILLLLLMFTTCATLCSAQVPGQQSNLVSSGGLTGTPGSLETVKLPDGSYLQRMGTSSPWNYFEASGQKCGTLLKPPVILPNGDLAFIAPCTGKTISFKMPQTGNNNNNNSTGNNELNAGNSSSGTTKKSITNSNSGSTQPTSNSSTPVTSSQNIHQTQFYPMGMHQRREDQTTLWQTQTPSALPQTIQSQFQAGMNPSQQFTLPLGTPTTYAKTPMHQFVPHAPALQTSSIFNVNDPPYDTDMSKFFWAQAPFQANSPTIGKIISDTGEQAALISMTNQLIDIGTAPQTWDQASKGMMWSQAQNASDAAASSSQNAFESNVEGLMQSLPNIANEQTGTTGNANAATKPLSQALWMVQQMFKMVYLPMSILFLLTGAVVTQARGYVKFTAMGGVLTGQDPDTLSPFVGILRATVAIFLIPATQLIVSFSIDIGNSMTYEVQQYIQASQTQAIDWSKQQTTANNTVKPGMFTPNSPFAQRTTAATLTHLAFNGIDMLLNYGLMVLIAFQLVLVCYLFLLGPLAASFFAWPAGIGTLFKPVFGSWLDGLTILVLWRFWWCVILLCMIIRIQWLQQLGQYVPNSQWESIMYTAFMVMLAYVPFLPFDFRPGDMVDTLLQKTGINPG